MLSMVNGARGVTEASSAGGVAGRSSTTGGPDGCAGLHLQHQSRGARARSCRSPPPPDVQLHGSAAVLAATTRIVSAPTNDVFLAVPAGILLLGLGRNADGSPSAYPGDPVTCLQSIRVNVNTAERGNDNSDVRSRENLPATGTMPAAQATPKTLRWNITHQPRQSENIEWNSHQVVAGHWQLNEWTNGDRDVIGAAPATVIGEYS